MLIGPVIMELQYEEVEKSSLENSKIGVTKKITDFSKLNCPTSSYHNSTNTGPIDMFFTKKCNYFSRETRWNHPLLSQPPLKESKSTLKLHYGFISHILYLKYTCTKILFAEKRAKEATKQILQSHSFKRLFCFWSHAKVCMLKIFQNQIISEATILSLVV